MLTLVSLGCTTTHQPTSLNDLSKEEIEAYNNDPKHTDKIVCKYETPIGSRISKKVCRLESTIEKRRQRDQQTADKIQIPIRKE